MFTSARRSIIGGAAERGEEMTGNKQQFNAIKSANNTMNMEKLDTLPPTFSPEYDVLRTDYERLMVQQIDLTESLNEKDDKINAYKKREKSLNEAMARKEKQHQENATITLQLGKRLEQALLDKEDLKDMVGRCKCSRSLSPWPHVNHATPGGLASLWGGADPSLCCRTRRSNSSTGRGSREL